MKLTTAISTLAAPQLLLLLWLPAGAADSDGKMAYQEACAPFTEETDAVPKRRNIPYSQGVFWRIDKDGIEASYLFGTMHSQDRQVANLSPRERLRLARSDRLLIEVEPDEDANQAYLDAMYTDNGHSLQEALSKPLFQRLKRIAENYGLSQDRINELEPWAAFSQIGRPKPVNGPTQDMLIYQTARQMGKPVIGLESMKELVGTLDTLPREDQITILKDTICNHARIVRESKTLRDLYLAGDLAGMVALNEQPHYDEALFERFMNAVLIERNQRMFKRMRPYLEEGGNFIAVGALHLPDKDGLLQLIEQAGYQVTPVDES